MTDQPPFDETKLTRTKRRWAEEGKFLTGRRVRTDAERLPPGQHLVRDWPVLDLGLTPNISENAFRLDVTGAVENPVSWNWRQFMDQPRSQLMSDIHCVTTWSRYDNHWEGLSTRDLLDIVRPRPEAGFVELRSSDGYTTNLPLEDLASADALVATHWEGKPLTPEHGGPARLVVPHLYFWKSAKWLNRIHFREGDKPGFWEVRGYHMRGDPWKEERYSED
ncbi:MAG TPA: sulfite oxidase-like oxidoreductase [Mesorhizobium sp.]|jgi:DMSO/TMAO reductase YedYZ molybdopterin-dependent catalytic subunit|nr:sulfite oxidase-like oxidoreductase [Mesorhizobium sp.]